MSSGRKYDPTAFSRRLLELKGEMSIRQFAALVGVSSGAIQHYLAGGEPRIAALGQMCENLDTDADSFLFGDELKDPEKGGKAEILRDLKTLEKYFADHPEDADFFHQLLRNTIPPSILPR